jgi:hypothetical protein
MNGKDSKQFKVIPSPAKKFFFHNIFELIGYSNYELTRKTDNWLLELGDVYSFTFYPFGQQHVIICDAKLSAAVLKQQPEIKDSFLFHNAKRWMGSDGIFFGNGNQQKTRMKYVKITANPKYYEEVSIFYIFGVEAGRC